MKSTDKKAEIRELAEADLATFIRLVHPNRVLGHVHIEAIQWWCRPGAKTHQLTLLPRDHQKSALIAYRVAWEITRNPALRVLYISSTSNLAIKQLKFIKDILLSDIYRFYWPEMVNPDEGKREKWTETEISVDHPTRKFENVRDPTIFTAGLTTGITGLHCDIIVLDDVVVYENAYTEIGRQSVRRQYSLLSSIGGTESYQWAVGTRYHPKDLYNDITSAQFEVYNDEGEVVGHDDLYETFERAVEDRGDGTGTFLWPRQQRRDGKWFGFDRSILAKKRAGYLDQTQFRAQYYNDPNDPEGGGIRDFQYYDKPFLTRANGFWYFKQSKLNVFASIDFAYSTKKSADYTAIVVIGVDSDHNYYILDIRRFKSGELSDYFKEILDLFQKWDFRKLRAEVTAAQEVIVNGLKSDYIRPHGLALSIDPKRPSAKEGSKAERVAAILKPRYDNKQIWHYMGGECQTLEEELQLENPPHDDVKDALASAIDMAVAPSRIQRAMQTMKRNIQNSRFGGLSGR